jgi:hypothetical protein
LYKKHFDTLSVSHQNFHFFSEEIDQTLHFQGNFLMKKFLFFVLQKNA